MTPRKEPKAPEFRLGEFASRAGDLSTRIRVHRLSESGADEVVWSGDALALADACPGDGAIVYYWAIGPGGKSVDL